MQASFLSVVVPIAVLPQASDLEDVMKRLRNLEGLMVRFDVYFGVLLWWCDILYVIIGELYTNINSLAYTHRCLMYQCIEPKVSL